MQSCSEPLQFLISYGPYCLEMRLSTLGLQAGLSRYSFPPCAGHMRPRFSTGLCHIQWLSFDQFPQMPVDPITSPPELLVTAPQPPAGNPQAALGRWQEP